MLKKTFLPLLSAVALCLTACGGDDEPPIPSDAITVNMMNESNGKTRLGDTDIYITNANNFKSGYCVLADHGRNGRLDAMPSFGTLSNEVAVTPGNYYQMFLSFDVEEIAGKPAVPVGSIFYNICVDAPIKDDNGVVIGAAVSYNECEAKAQGLPDWDADIDIDMYDREHADYKFDKDVVIDPEYEVIGDDLLEETLEVSISGNRISFTNVAYTPECRATVLVQARKGSLFTMVAFKVSTRSDNR